MSQNSYHTIPSLADGNLASRILGNPASAIDGGHSVPTWEQMNIHLVGLKHQIFELTNNATGAYNHIASFGHRVPEASSLINRLCIDAEKACLVINEISLKSEQNYKGAARTAEESQRIVFGSTEATEAFTSFLTGNTLTIQSLQEIFMQAQLAQRQEQAMQEATAKA